MKRTLLSLRKSIERAKKKKVDMNEKIDPEKALYDFSEREKQYLQRSIISSIKLLSKKTDDPLIGKLQQAKTYEEMENVIAELEKIEPKKEKKVGGLKVSVPKLPVAIREEISADVDEMKECYSGGLYRSATILCGRILEVALHRKYFEVTGKDILVTNPGVGLGKLIAKLKEKEVEFAPGVTEQIHLVNQIRVEAVHKKTKVFYPTKEQTQATILYSMDILKKLF